MLDRGLWRYTRHPGYFGDAVVRAGLWLLACLRWLGLSIDLAGVAGTLPGERLP